MGQVTGVAEKHKYDIESLKDFFHFWFFPIILDNRYNRWLEYMSLFVRIIANQAISLPNGDQAQAGTLISFTYID